MITEILTLLGLIFFGLGITGLIIYLVNNWYNDPGKEIEKLQSEVKQKDEIISALRSRKVRVVRRDKTEKWKKPWSYPNIEKSYNKKYYLKPKSGGKSEDKWVKS